MTDVHRDPATLYDRLALYMRILAGAGIVLVGVGTVLSLIRVGHLDTTLTPLSDVPSGVGALDPGAFTSLGVLVFLATPALGLAYVSLAFLIVRNWLYALCAAIVLMILLGSLIIASWTGA